MAKQQQTVTLKDGSFLVVGKGTYSDVLLLSEAREEYESVQKKRDTKSVQAARTLQRYFERYAESGPTALNDKMFKTYGREKVDGTPVLIHEFKAYQHRIYGVCDERNGKRCFYGLTCDPEKKQDKAKSGKAKKAAMEWMEMINGQG